MPKACRKMDNTMMIRTNEVIMSNIDGSSVLTSSQGSIVPATAGQRATLNNAGVIDLSSGEPELVRQGTHSLGDPAWLLPQWLHHACAQYGKLPAGTDVTTGTWVGIVVGAVFKIVLALTMLAVFALALHHRLKVGATPTKASIMEAMTDMPFET